VQISTTLNEPDGTKGYAPPPCL